MPVIDKDSAITLVNYSKFCDETEVIANSTYNFPKGRVAVFIGKSEREKTLLLRSIAGHERLTSGDIVINGVSVSRDKSAFKREVFIVSASTNLDLPGPLAKLPKLLASVYLEWDYIAYRAWLDFLKLPEGVSYSDLSHDNKMKALTAIAVACGAGVVIFESIDSYLTVGQQRALLVTLEAKASKGKSALIGTRHVSRWVAHDLDLYAFKNAQLMKVDRDRLRDKVMKTAIVSAVDSNPRVWQQSAFSGDENTHTMVLMPAA